MSGTVAHWKVEPLVRYRRSWEERQALRAPAIAARTVASSLRLPVASRVRRALVTRTILGGMAASNRGDFEVMSMLLHPEVVLRATEETRGPGIELEYVGKEGYVQAVKAWREPFDDHRYEVQEIFDGGGGMLAARVGAVGRGRASGVEIRRVEFHVWELVDGLVRRQWVVSDQAEMFELLGGSVPSTLC